jgi:Flp pilus assembly pilin Flp
MVPIDSVLFPLDSEFPALPSSERTEMKNLFLNLYVKFLGLKHGEEAQDLVEYALLLALIALVCVTSVGSVAGAITSVFSDISASLS